MDILVNDNTKKTEILRNKAADVRFPLSAEIKALVKDMKEALHALGGVGLAAPQVGQALRIIAVYIPKEPASLREHATLVPMTVFFNPSYVAEDSTMVLDWELCYSVKDIMGKVPRHFRIRFDAQDELGQPVRLSAHGHYARVLQHEVDHTDGRLCDELMIPSSKGSIKDMTPVRRSEMIPERQVLFDEFLSRKK